MLRVVSPPAAQLATLKEVKAQLRLDHSEEDSRLRTLMAVAQEQVEGLTQRRYVSQTLEWVLQSWPCEVIFPVAPVASVTWVKYVDQNGTTQTFDPSLYDVRPLSQATMLLPKRFVIFPPFLGDAPEPIVIRFVAGGDPAAVPASAKLAFLLTVENLYDNGAAAEPPDIVPSLLMGEAWGY